MQFGGQPTPWSEVEIESLRLRSVSQILIQEIGAAGPENVEESARRACGVIQRMADQIVSADARIAELEQSVTVRDTEVARLRNKINSMLEILSDELPKATRRRVGARFNAELDNKP